MKEITSKLILFRELGKDSALNKLSNILCKLQDKDYDKDKVTNLILSQVYKIIELGSKYQFKYDLWASYLLYILMSNENPFTLAVERKSSVNETLKNFALNDFEIFIQLINYDFSKIEQELNIDCFNQIKNYTNDNQDIIRQNHNLGNIINSLYDKINSVKDTQKFYEIMLDFYKKYGVGDFGLYKAFRLSPIKDDKLIIPISGTSNILFTDLIGYEEQKKDLINNTEAFVNNQPANNVLLYGDAGTGKSSSIKSLLNVYYEKGLRMIEVYKQDFQYLPEIMSVLKNRNYHFILYFDDLSFEKNETEYKYLKAIIEGGLEIKPSNVLIYATSNRTHLLHETFSDRKEVETDDVHISDTLTEQTSLASRFGLTIAYFSPKRQEFLDMIVTMASKYEKLSKLNKDELIDKAILWNRYHKDMSGRSAKQFIDSLLSQSVDLANK